MNHVDIFGNPIEVGDIVLRICSGHSYMTEIMALRPSGIGIRRARYEWADDFSRRITVKSNNPKILWIDRWGSKYQIINLSKLDNSKIQETIKVFANEI